MKSLLLVLCWAALGSGRVSRLLPDGFPRLTSSFSCHGRPFGYYADVESDCHAYHVCLPMVTEGGAVYDMAHYSFACGPDLVFSQTSLVCTHAVSAGPCGDAPDMYHASNSGFGKVDDKPRRKAKTRVLKKVVGDKREVEEEEEELEEEEEEE